MSDNAPSPSIVFDIGADELTESDRSVISESLGISSEDFLEEMGKLAKCAFLEYRKMFVERGLPTKADEIMQDRLYYLIKGFFGGVLPNEQQISVIFQLTLSSSKTLLKNTVSRYRIHLHSELRESIRAALRTVEQDGENYNIVIQSDSLKNEINMLLTQKRPMLKKLLLVKGSAGQYFCPIDTKEFLFEEFAIDE